MNTVLGSAGTNKTSTYVSLLDFKKAFDSVSQNTLVGILRDLGLSPRLVGYIHTQLTLGDDWFRQGRGVLQGDPLSPYLFNILIDYILAGLPTDIGVDVGGHKVSAIAYADDIVLFASSRVGLSHILDQFIERAQAIGPTLGVRKFATAELNG